MITTDLDNNLIRQQTHLRITGSLDVFRMAFETIRNLKDTVRAIRGREDHCYPRLRKGLPSCCRGHCYGSADRTGPTPIRRVIFRAEQGVHTCYCRHRRPQVVCKSDFVYGLSLSREISIHRVSVIFSRLRCRRNSTVGHNSKKSFSDPEIEARSRSSLANRMQLSASWQSSPSSPTLPPSSFAPPLLPPNHIHQSLPENLVSPLPSTLQHRSQFLSPRPHLRSQCGHRMSVLLTQSKFTMGKSRCHRHQGSCLDRIYVTLIAISSKTMLRCVY